MGLFNDKVVNQTKDILKEMRDPVGITYFTQDVECDLCRMARTFLEELSGIEGRLQVERRDFVQDRDLAAKMGIHHIPALVLRKAGEERSGVRYFGVPGGYEFGAFLRTLVMFSTGQATEAVDPAAVSEIDREVNLKVFVLVTCPACPAMAYLCNTLAFMNPRITTEIIEANSFVDLSNRFKVSAVPKVVINDTLEVVGAVPAPELIRKIKSL